MLIFRDGTWDIKKKGLIASPCTESLNYLSRYLSEVTTFCFSFFSSRTSEVNAFKKTNWKIIGFTGYQDDRKLGLR